MLRGINESFQHGIHASLEFSVDHVAGGDCEIKFVFENYKNHGVNVTQLNIVQNQKQQADI